MAFWRWSTMDTRNPFKFKFWNFANLFGQSDLEKISALKIQKLKTLNDQIKFSHPTKSQSTIICPLTNKHIVNPVITIEGKIYEKYALLRHIAKFDKVAGSNMRITRDDIYEFKGLKVILEYAQSRLDLYLNKELAILKNAEEIITRQSFNIEHAKLFICPLSKKLINKPVITPMGRVYEKESIRAYLEITSNNSDPVDGSPLCLDSLVAFNEFEICLVRYKNNPADFKIQVGDVLHDAIDGIKTGANFLGDFFVKPKIPTDEGKMIPRPSMAFL